MEEKVTETVETPAKKEKKKKDKTVVKQLTVKANKKGLHINHFMNFLRVVLIPIYYFFKPFRYYGNWKLPKGAQVIVCNHYTIYDAIYGAATTWEEIHFVSKREIFENPFSGFLFRGMRAICANRDGNDVRTMLNCMKCLKNGEKVLICPEGTRNKTDAEMLPFHHGASVMAIKTKTPIIPMMMYKKPRFFRMTHMLVGEPVELTEYYDKKLTAEDIEEADNKIREMMLQLRRDHTAYLESKKSKKKDK